METKGYKLSAREKILITLVAIIGLTAGIVYFVVMPMMAAHEDAASELDAARLARMQVMSRIPAVEILRASIETSRNDLDRYRFKHIPYIQTENLESEFTMFLLLNGIKPTKVMLAPADTANPADELYKFTVSISGSGVIENLLRLADYTNGKYSYRLTSMALTPSGSLFNADYTVEATLKR